MISGDVAVSWVLGACSLTCVVTVLRGLVAALMEHPAEHELCDFLLQFLCLCWTTAVCSLMPGSPPIPFLG